MVYMTRFRGQRVVDLVSRLKGCWVKGEEAGEGGERDAGCYIPRDKLSQLHSIIDLNSSQLSNYRSGPLLAVVFVEDDLYCKMTRQMIF